MRDSERLNQFNQPFSLLSSQDQAAWFRPKSFCGMLLQASLSPQEQLFYNYYYYFLIKNSPSSSQKSKCIHIKYSFGLNLLERTWVVLFQGPCAMENYPHSNLLAPLSKMQAELQRNFKYLNYQWKNCILNQAASIFIDEITDYFCYQFKYMWYLREVQRLKNRKH